MSAEDRLKWEQRYSVVGFEVAPPSLVLRRLQPFFPPIEGTDPAQRPRALDVAGGPGRHAIWLAELGYRVTLIDIAEAGLRIARDRASQHGVQIETIQLDLDETPLPPGPWDLILCTMILDRTLFKRAAAVLDPQGTLVYLQPTRTNLTRHEKPPAGFLLEDGEMPNLVTAAGLNIIHYEEGWLEDGRHDACVVARLP